MKNGVTSPPVTFATMVKTDELPLATEKVVQVTRIGRCEQFHPLGVVRLTKVRLFGANTSDNVTLEAAFGPLLRTVIV